MALVESELEASGQRCTKNHPTLFGCPARARTVLKISCCSAGIEKFKKRMRMLSYAQRLVVNCLSLYTFSTRP